MLGFMRSAMVPPEYPASCSICSRLQLLPGFLPQEQADWMFSKLLAELPWSQKTNYGMMGEAYVEPRLTCWYGELPYTYSHSTMQANPEWHPILLNLRQAIEREISHTFNSLLCNLYRDGKDSIAWHSDNEVSLGPRPTIASFSLGDTRVFSLRKKPPPEENSDYIYAEKVKIPLSHGTLLIMEGCTQDDWQADYFTNGRNSAPFAALTQQWPSYKVQHKTTLESSNKSQGGELMNC
ncbi:alpha-ketoglutarate-dependent dioxygenase alkB homolog 3 isoform X4 [Ictalurus furcatus]|uniref:alpha-ketoglutarate-dependent dioxygenase alkB homolog 3 isoform X4 n=1 Tax=Ictalurus furcatus TaxID=66913 RepID=UPI002350D699|nr:alpha-ketoglutarate-dependent dioxygenase alkB homolog 3 isoform X4 [Ictalurus furcatus]